MPEDAPALPVFACSKASDARKMLLDNRYDLTLVRHIRDFSLKSRAYCIADAEGETGARYFSPMQWAAEWQELASVADSMCSTRAFEHLERLEKIEEELKKGPDDDARGSIYAEMTAILKEIETAL